MATYTPLQSVVLTSTSTSVSFTGIDQSYTDLVVVSSFLKPTGGSPRFRLNVDSSALYSQTILYGNGTSALSGRETGQTAYYLMDYFNPSTTNANFAIVHLLNYSNITTFKTMLERSGSADIGTEVSIGLYRSTNAVTSITINADGSTGVFSTGSTFDLYGIKSGAPQALGGDVVTTDGNYWYHTFRSTGAFIPQRPLTVDYLVIAGGGGAGGNRGSGGGGAGGFRTATSFAVSNLATVTVGAGGTGLETNTRGSSGTDSVFASITSVGGGGGGGDTAGQSPLTGGSGGGGNYLTSSGAGAAGTSGQGNQGGTGSGAGINYAGGGGGGASAAGSNGAPSGSEAGSAGGNGGAGTASSISGSSVTYAGGGGGSGWGSASVVGTGGAGGGGNSGGGGTANGSNGTTNLGGGGGGGAAGKGGNGGSGVVIVRYPV
jgi:hypothetical protein